MLIINKIIYDYVHMVECSSLLWHTCPAHLNFSSTKYMSKRGLISTKFDKNKLKV